MFLGGYEVLVWNGNTCKVGRIPNSESTESGYKANEQNDGGGKCLGFAIFGEARFVVMII